MSTLKDRLIEARQEAGLSQADLAARVSCGQTTVASIENGRNKGATPLVKIAHVLGVNPLWLVEGLGPKALGHPAPNGIVLRQATTATDSADLVEICGLLRRLNTSDRRLVLAYAQALADKGQAPRKSKRCLIYVMAEWRKLKHAPELLEI